jgi:hypothetical protein
MTEMIFLMSRIASITYYYCIAIVEEMTPLSIVTLGFLIKEEII